MGPVGKTARGRGAAASVRSFAGDLHPEWGRAPRFPSAASLPPDSAALGHAAQPVVDVEGGIAGQVAPELDAVDDLEATFAAGPGVLVAEDVTDGGILQ